MARFGDDDLAVFFGDGVPVTFAGNTVTGLFDEPSQDQMLGGHVGGVDAVQRVLLLPFNAFNPLPEPKQAITVDGANFTIFSKRPLDDGRIVQFELKSA